MVACVKSDTMHRHILQVIVHWHGPKPERCLKCYIALWEQSKNNEEAIELCQCDSGYDYLWNMAMEADSARLYRKAFRDYTTYAKIINGTGNIMDSDAMLGAF